MKLKKIISLLLAGTITMTSAVFTTPTLLAAAEDILVLPDDDVPPAMGGGGESDSTEEETIGYSAEWVENNGVYTITNNFASELDATKIEPLSISNVWRSTCVVKADVQLSTGEIWGAYTYSDDTTDWSATESFSINTTKKTVTFDGSAQYLNWLNLSLWGLPAGTTATVSNIVVTPIYQWTYTDGVYSFKNPTDGEFPAEQLAPLSIKTEERSDWSEIELITVPVKTTWSGTIFIDSYCATDEGKLSPVRFDAVDSTSYITFATNGKKVNSIELKVDTDLLWSVGITIGVPQYHTANRTPEFTEGKWMQLDDGTYCFNTLTTEITDEVYSADTVIPLSTPANMKWSDVQTVYFDARSIRYGGTVVLHATKADGTKFKQEIVVRNQDEMSQSYVNVFGALYSNVYLQIGAMGKGQIVYVGNFRYSSEPIEEVPIDPNDILIDRSEMLFGEWDITNTIMETAFEKINTTGTLKVYTEHIDGHYHEIMIGLCAPNGDWTNLIEGQSRPLAEDEVIEFKVDKEMLSALKSSTFNLLGAYFKYTKMVFTPDSDTPAPEIEAVVPDEKEKEQLDKEFAENKQYIKPESEGPKKGSDMDENKLYVQKSDVKERDGKRVHAFRFVKKIKKSEAASLKDVSLFLGVDGKYIELKTNYAYNSLNINGAEVEAGEGYVFVVFIIDNVPEDREFSFSDLKCNK